MFTKDDEVVAAPRRWRPLGETCEDAVFVSRRGRTRRGAKYRISPGYRVFHLRCAGHWRTSARMCWLPLSGSTTVRQNGRNRSRAPGPQAPRLDPSPRRYCRSAKVGQHHANSQAYQAPAPGRNLGRVAARRTAAPRGQVTKSGQPRGGEVSASQDMKWQDRFRTSYKW